jgi:hypothetical protein
MCGGVKWKNMMLSASRERRPVSAGRFGLRAAGAGDDVRWAEFTASSLMLAAVERNLTPMGTDRAPIFETKTTADWREETRIEGDDYWRVRVPV